MADPTDSAILLQQARQIEETAFWKRYVEKAEIKRRVAQRACWEKGDKEFEKGMVRAFDMILGNHDMTSLFETIKTEIGG